MGGPGDTVSMCRPAASVPCCKARAEPPREDRERRSCKDIFRGHTFGFSRRGAAPASPRGSTPGRQASTSRGGAAAPAMATRVGQRVHRPRRPPNEATHRLSRARARAPRTLPATSARPLGAEAKFPRSGRSHSSASMAGRLRVRLCQCVIVRTHLYLILYCTTTRAGPPSSAGRASASPSSTRLSRSRVVSRRPGAR